MSTKYGTILADPPWPERGGGKIKRGADRHYALMSVSQIASLPVQSLAAPDSHLYLWVTNNYLPAGLSVLAAWGFRYITAITWAKDKIGLGQYFRGQTEHCLFGVRGKPGYRLGPLGNRQQGTTLITAPRTRHSEKPQQLRAMIERVSCGPYLELFARDQVENWDVWGNEVLSSIELDTARIPEMGSSNQYSWL
jgi:N6-adenosine-specific RNA methylase IME4